MSGWETTVATGNPEQDHLHVEHYRQQARAAGMELQVQPLPTGGYFVRAIPAPAVQSWGAPNQAPPPQQAWGNQAYAQQSTPATPSFASQAGGVAVIGPTTAAQQAAPLTQERIVYLRKVYGLLAIACAIAVFCGFAILYLTPTEVFRYRGHKVHVPLMVAEMVNNPGLMYGAFLALVGATFVASWVSKVKVVNVIMLFLVAALMGLDLAPMAFIAQMQGELGNSLSAAPVRDAFLLTGSVFAGITAYVFISRKDFSYLYATLAMGFWVVLVASILGIFVGSEPFSLAIASVGALVAAGFLLVQTSSILRGDMDDPVEDALVFLVQLRNLFMFILRILMSSRR